MPLPGGWARRTLGQTPPVCAVGSGPVQARVCVQPGASGWWLGPGGGSPRPAGLGWSPGPPKRAGVRLVGLGAQGLSTLLLPASPTRSAQSPGYMRPGRGDSPRGTQPRTPPPRHLWVKARDPGGKGHRGCGPRGKAPAAPRLRPALRPLSLFVSPQELAFSAAERFPESTWAALPAARPSRRARPSPWERPPRPARGLPPGHLPPHGPGGALPEAPTSKASRGVGLHM